MLILWYGISPRYRHGIEMLFLLLAICGGVMNGFPWPRANDAERFWPIRMPVIRQAVTLIKDRAMTVGSVNGDTLEFTGEFIVQIHFTGAHQNTKTKTKNKEKPNTFASLRVCVNRIFH